MLVFLGVDRSWRNGSDFIFLGRRWNPFSTFSCSSMPQPLYSSCLSFLWKQGFNARICLVGRWCLVADGFCVGRCEICMWPRTIFMRTQSCFFGKKEGFYSRKKKSLIQTKQDRTQTNKGANSYNSTSKSFNQLENDRTHSKLFPFSKLC